MADTTKSAHISSMRQFKAILKKDIVMELRTKEMLTSMGLYAVLVLVVYQIALSQAGSSFDVLRIAAGLLWLAIIFTSLLGLNRSLVHEKDQGCLDALLLAPVDRPVIFFAKAIGNLLFLSIVVVIILPLFYFFFLAGKPIGGPLWMLPLPLIVGCIGIAGVGAATQVGLQSRRLQLHLGRRFEVSGHDAGMDFGRRGQLLQERRRARQRPDGGRAACHMLAVAACQLRREALPRVQCDIQLDRRFGKYFLDDPLIGIAIRHHRANIAGKPKDF